MNCKCECEDTVYTPPNPCAPAPISTNKLKLYTLRCGTWMYSGEMSINTAPYPGMRIVWDNKPYSIEQATLVGSEPAIDKWEVMLITSPSYSANSPCMPNPCPPTTPPVLPPEEAPGGVYVEDCNNYHYYHNMPNTPRPVEMGLGCGPHYGCNGYPY